MKRNRSRAAERRAWRRTVITAGTVAGLLTVAGCGSQVSHSRIVAVGNGYSAQIAPASTGGVAAAGEVTGDVPAAAAGTSDAAAVPAAGTTGGKPAAGTGTTTAGQGVAASGSAGKPAAGSAGKSDTSTSKTGGTGTQDRPCTSRLAPIVLGQTLATSGLIGSTVGNTRPGLAIWAQWVNSRGGIACHPVQVISLDDGSDSARVASNWNTLKGRGMVAMVGAAEPITMGALRSAAERDKIPVIGGDLVDTAWFESPWVFPQGAHPYATFDGSLYEAAKATPDAKTAGLVYCVEASICTNIKNNFPKSARLAGLSVALTKAVSLTQSDFTAECQAMKDAKVDVLWLALDGSANTRLGRSCDRLGYKPQLSTNALGVPPAVSEDPLLSKATVYLAAATVPFSTTDTPGAAEFAQATKRFAPSLKLDQSVMMGWSAGKLFEAALLKVADRARAGGVTTAMVLDGLHQLKNEKLSGLSPGVTFEKGKPATAPRCYYALLLNTSGVTAPLGSRVRCLKE